MADIWLLKASLAGSIDNVSFAEAVMPCKKKIRRKKKMVAGSVSVKLLVLFCILFFR